jgi:hypothetical protein
LSVLILLFATTLPDFGQQPAPTAPLPSVALPPGLDHVLRDYERAWRARDADALAGLFTAAFAVFSWAVKVMFGGARHTADRSM